MENKPYYELLAEFVRKHLLFQINFDCSNSGYNYQLIHKNCMIFVPPKTICDMQYIVCLLEQLHCSCHIYSLM